MTKKKRKPRQPNQILSCPCCGERLRRESMTGPLVKYDAEAMRAMRLEKLAKARRAQAEKRKIIQDPRVQDLIQQIMMEETP